MSNLDHSMPSTIESAIVLLVLAIPGYIALQRYRTNYPVSYHRTAPTILGEIVLYVSLSVLVNILVIFIFALIILLISLFLPDVGTTEIPNKIANITEVFFVAIVVVAYFAIAFGVVWCLTHRAILGRFLHPDLPLSWEELVFLGTRQQVNETAYWVLVHFKEGGQCLGAISKMRWVGGQENSIEVVLEHTYYRSADTAEAVNIGRLLLKTKDVAWLGLYRS